MDIRDRDPNAAKRWSDETVFSNRAYFLFDKLPGELAVQNAKDSDTGNKFSYQLHFPTDACSIHSFVTFHDSCHANLRSIISL